MCDLCNKSRRWLIQGALLAPIVAMFARVAPAKALGDEVSPRIVPQGTPFKCENGHVLCEAIENISFGEANWHLKIGKFRMAAPQVGQKVPDCPECGARLVFWRKNNAINGL